MNITIKVDDRGMLYVEHDGDQTADVTLVNRQLQTTTNVPPREREALPYRIREAELLSPDDWDLTPEAAAEWDAAFQREVAG